MIGVVHIKITDVFELNINKGSPPGFFLVIGKGGVGFFFLVGVDAVVVVSVRAGELLCSFAAPFCLMSKNLGHTVCGCS